jgi:hypothetical protein
LQIIVFALYDVHLSDYARAVRRALPRFHRELERLEDERRLARMLVVLGEEAPPVRCTRCVVALIGESWRSSLL